MERADWLDRSMVRVAAVLAQRGGHESCCFGALPGKIVLLPGIASKIPSDLMKTRDLAV